MITPLTNVISRLKDYLGYVRLLFEHTLKCYGRNNQLEQYNHLERYLLNEWFRTVSTPRSCATCKKALLLIDARQWESHSCAVMTPLLHRCHEPSWVSRDQIILLFVNMRAYSEIRAEFYRPFQCALHIHYV